MFLNQLHGKGNIVLETAPFLVLFVADQRIAYLDFQGSIEDDATFVPLADFIGIFFVALEIPHVTVSKNLIAALYFKKGSPHDFSLGNPTTDDHISFSGFEHREDGQSAEVGAYRFRRKQS